MKKVRRALRPALMLAIAWLLAAAWIPVRAGGTENATPTDLGLATPTDLGPATPTDLGPATPTDLGPATPTDLGPATPTDLGPATPTDLGPAAPVLRADRDTLLLGESVVLTAEAEGDEFRLVRTGADGAEEVMTPDSCEGGRVTYTDTLSGFPEDMEGQVRQAVYRLKYRDRETGAWSAYSEAVTVDLYLYSTIPTPELDLPSSIPADSMGVEVSVTNALPGLEYEMTGGSLSVERLSAASWRVIPMSDGGSGYIHVHAQTESLPLAYVNLFLEITEADFERAAAPEVTLLTERPGRTQTIRVDMEGITDVGVRYNGEFWVFPCESGGKVTFTLPNPDSSYVELYAQVYGRKDGRWSQPFSMQCPLARLEKPAAAVWTDEYGRIPSGKDVKISLKAIPGAVSVLVYSQTNYSQSGSFGMMYMDSYHTTVPVTGGDMVITLPGEYFSFRERDDRIYYSNTYEISLTALPAQESEYSSSETCILRVQTALSDLPTEDPWAGEEPDVPPLPATPTDLGPAAPVLKADRSTLLRGQSATLSAWADADEFQLVRTGPDGEETEIPLTTCAEGKATFTDRFDSVPQELEGQIREAVYRVRCRDRETGDWSAFSAEVRMDFCLYSQLPTPELNLPASLPLDSPGVDIRVTNALPGVSYAISSDVLSIERLGEASWHVTPLAETACGYLGMDISTNNSYLGMMSNSQWASFQVTPAVHGRRAAPEVEVLTEGGSLMQKLRVSMDGLTDVCVRLGGEAKTVPCASGETVTVTLSPKPGGYAEVYGRSGGVWSEPARVFLTTLKMAVPEFTVCTDENGRLPSGEDVALCLKVMPYAGEVLVESYAEGYISGNSVRFDWHSERVQATGKNMVIMLPGEYFKYKDSTNAISYFNRYHIQVTVHSAEGYDIAPSTSSATVSVAQETSPVRSPYALRDEDSLHDARLQLPASAAAIESQAFAGLARPCTVIVPAGVEFIADDAFEGSDVILVVKEGSYARRWAEEHRVFHYVQGTD